jgi:hypothetical protein
MSRRVWFFSRGMSLVLSLGFEDPDQNPVFYLSDKDIRPHMDEATSRIRSTEENASPSSSSVIL